jgi:hypothetical protein
MREMPDGASGEVMAAFTSLKLAEEMLGSEQLKFNCTKRRRGLRPMCA